MSKQLEDRLDYKVGEEITIVFLEDVLFWGGVAKKKGERLTGLVERVENGWIGFHSLAIPNNKIKMADND